MAKRFTDTEKWERPWFRQLSAEHKSLWLYILDKCDIAGVWYVDLELAGFMLRSQFNPDEVSDALSKQIVKLEGGKKWWISGFPRFQYGCLRPGVRLHDSVIKAMSSYKEMGSELNDLLVGGKGLKRVKKGLPRTYLSPKDKVKDILVVSKEGVVGGIPPALEDVRAYCKERGNSVDPHHWYDFYESKGWVIGNNKMKDWKAAVRTWERNAFGAKSAPPTSDPYAGTGYKKLDPKDAHDF